MTPEQQADLRAAIHADPACAEALANKDCQALAIIRSVGRTRTISRAVTERGIRAVLPVKEASRFIVMLKELSEGVPAWLDALLAAAGVPADEYGDYAETFSCAYVWLRQEAGLDIGVDRTRSMLDLLANAPGGHALAASTIKALAEVPDPYTALEIGVAVYNDDGSMK